MGRPRSPVSVNASPKACTLLLILCLALVPLGIANDAQAAFPKDYGRIWRVYCKNSTEPTAVRTLCYKYGDPPPLGSLNINAEQYTYIDIQYFRTGFLPNLNPSSFQITGFAVVKDVIQDETGYVPVAIEGPTSLQCVGSVTCAPTMEDIELASFSTVARSNGPEFDLKILIFGPGEGRGLSERTQPVRETLNALTIKTAMSPGSASKEPALSR